jgi:hypothetical protein
MKTEDNTTYQEACQFIADEWNKTKASDAGRKASWKDIWNIKEFKTFPALYIRELYEKSKIDLMGLLLTNPFYSKIFLREFIDDKEESKVDFDDHGDGLSGILGTAFGNCGG